MRHKKRGLALLLLLALPLLCGCEGMVSERPMEDLSGWVIEPGAQAPTQDAFDRQTQTVTLYLLSSDGERLVPVPAEVTLQDGESAAHAALTALLDGAKLGRTDALWPMSDEGKAPTLSVSAGIATVNLPARYRALEPQTLFAVRQAVADTLGSLSGIAYVNVMKNMSVDCDCCAVAEDPCMADIGILVSTDPVAIDQACLDLVYAATDDPGREHLIERIESRNGVHTVEAAAALGVGSREYELVEVE